MQILALMCVPAAQAGGGHGDKVQGVALLSIHLLPGMRQGADWGPCWDLIAESGLCKNLSLPSPPTDPPVQLLCVSITALGAAFWRSPPQPPGSACMLEKQPYPRTVSGVQGRAGGNLQKCYLHPTPIFLCEGDFQLLWKLKRRSFTFTCLSWELQA